MAEENQPIVSNQRLIIAISVVVIAISLFLLWNFRGCMPMSASKGPSDVRIYTNLDLKDAANVITRLKELKIPYKIEQDGSAISVPKEKADDARLGLAEKNLPQGGAVGWEIFNETRMGATDFDRRIQLIRAISGELSRTIRRIEGVDDVRVQIVLPETRLFEVTKAPVTAAVLLKMMPGVYLRLEQINGIIHLVASSVENLKAENVTIVDDMGNILSSKALNAVEEFQQKPIIRETMPQKEIEKEVKKKVGPEIAEEQEEAKKTEEKITEKVEGPVKSEVKAKFSLPFNIWPINKQKEAAAEKPIEKPVEKQIEKPAKLSAEEKALLKLKAKEEYERQLTSKVQELLSQFYPQNGVIVRVNVMFGDSGSWQKATKLKIRSDAGFIIAPIRKITTIVLIDNSFPLSYKLKKSTYQTIALAISYNKLRGDRMILKQVPFHYASVQPISPKKPFQINLLNYFLWASGAIIVIAIFFIAGRFAKRKQINMPFEHAAESSAPSVPSESEATTTVKQIQDIAHDNPERLANLLKKWLTEEDQ
ncbi:flagellar M-ring protein FliF [Candidatus Saganbacteria bacterium]|nr:flagellar M-ring protein FliF [Candidatus Saganbacteria bacterium]